MEESTPEQLKLLSDYHDMIRQNYGSSDLRAAKTNHAEITKEFVQKGLKLRTGRWTFLEKKRLHQNFEKFVERYQSLIGNPVDFVVVPDDHERHVEVRRLKNELTFGCHLAEGLYRDVGYVRAGSESILHPLAVCNGQKYSVEDLHKLKRLVEEYDGSARKKWQTIGMEMGRTKESAWSAYRNFFYYCEDFGSSTPTKKQQKKLIKILEKLFPEKDLPSELLHNVPWTMIAKKIGYDHGKYLAFYYDSVVKVRNEEGKIVMQSPKRPSTKMLVKFIKVLVRQKPTHLDAVNYDECFKILRGYVPSIEKMKHLIVCLLRKYRINYQEEEDFTACLKRLYKILKRAKKLGFDSIWKEVRKETLTLKRWQSFHWALSPELAHYAHSKPYMHWGFDEYETHEIKQEIGDDEVW